VTPEPVRSAFIRFTDPLEGYCPFPYTDDVGLVTCARGKLIDPGPRRMTPDAPIGASTPAWALPLPWTVAGVAATPETVSNAFWAVKRAWPRVQSFACAGLTTIRLSRDAVDQLTLEQLDEMWASALKYFPDLGAAPPPAQLGVLSMSWAMGGAFEAGYPHFDAAVLAKNWALAAAQCSMNKSPVPVERNRRNRLLFLAAAAGAPLTPDTWNLVQ